MYQQIFPFLMFLLLSIESYAIDLNNTSEIISQASVATEGIQNEIDFVVIQGETIIPKIEEVVKEPIIMETPLVETSLSNSDENQTVIENNTTVIELPLVKTLLPNKEENQTVIENNTSNKETNSTLNKETFDMSQGEVERGETIFIKNFKNICEIEGSGFAKKYAQDEWEELATEGKFEKSIFNFCPKIETTYKTEWSTDLYQFFYENANDSEEIPEY